MLVHSFSYIQLTLDFAVIPHVFSSGRIESVTNSLALNARIPLKCRSLLIIDLCLWMPGNKQCRTHLVSVACVGRFTAILLQLRRDDCTKASRKDLKRPCWDFWISIHN